MKYACQSKLYRWKDHDKIYEAFRTTMKSVGIVQDLKPVSTKGLINVTPYFANRVKLVLNWKFG
ncbi:MAG: hypothetical protein C5B52_08715 [Bacteroidetes bacterium]|nr:MAG: hypothetical protein C5B52_08715 [Bacteroidota bacterium]